MRYYIEVTAPSLPAERFEVSKGSGAIGCDPSDVVFVPSSAGLPPSAIQIEVGDSGVELQAKGSVNLEHAGVSLKSTTVKWGNEIYSGGVCLTMLAEGGDERSVSPVVWVLLTLLCVLGIAVAVELAPTETAGATPARFEFTPPSGAACPKEGAQSQAAQLARVVSARKERYPFAQREGALVLDLLAKRKACLVEAGESQAAQKAEEELLSWVQKLDQDFEALEASLLIDLQNGRFESALLALKGLENLLSTSSGAQAEAYLAWLAGLKEQIRWKVRK